MNNTNSNLFSNNDPGIQFCRDIKVATIKNTQYNLVFEQDIGVYLYDTNWKYVSTFNFPSILYGIVANGYYYFSTHYGTYGLVKTSVDSPNIVNYYGMNFAGVYRGLFYDKTVIAAGYGTRSVDVFDLNLNLNRSITFPDFSPHSVTIYESKIYAFFWENGMVALISNNGTVSKYFPTLCSHGCSINFDSFGYCAVSCCVNGALHLYDTNMKYTNYSLTFANDVEDIAIDTNDRLAMCLHYDAAVYY